MQRAIDAAGVPAQVGAILTLAPVDAERTSDVDERAGSLREAWCAALAPRVRTVPRLRQRLVDAPFGCGRPYWIDDPSFDITRHVRVCPCPPPGDEQAVLRQVAELVTTPLPRDRPLWSALLLTGLSSGEAGFVVVFHHVLADGIGGLAALGALVDPSPASPERASGDDDRFPQPAPSRSDLLRDAWSSRLAAARSWRAGFRRLRLGIGELRTTPRLDAPRSSLNRPTSPHRAMAVVRAPLAPLLAVARAHGAKFNDVILTAVGAAVADLLASRGETLPEIVVSVPVSARTEANAADLGNQVGAFPVSVPLSGDLADRLDAVATTTRARSAPSGASAAILEPAFRGMAALHLLHRFVDRQRLVNTFVTNLHGPDTRLVLLDRQITGITAVTISEGNVTVAFAVLSYAGNVAITVLVDPTAVSTGEHLRMSARLEHHLAVLAALTPARA